MGCKMARREWTIKEEKYMNKHYLQQPAKITAKHLDRTVISVRKKAAQMGLNNYYGDFLGARTIAKCFDIDVSVVIRWIEKLNLPATKVRESKNKTRYQIDPEQFWKWADDHRSEINWSRYEICSILPEPRWVEFEKARYKTKRYRQHFTDNEIVQVKHMLHRGMNAKEIATEIGRTEDGIKHLIRKIA